MATITTSMNINLEPAPSGLSSENNLYMAKVAEAADRFDGAPPAPPASSHGGRMRARWPGG